LAPLDLPAQRWQDEPLALGVGAMPDDRRGGQAPMTRSGRFTPARASSVSIIS
jgi:hypothetical protein